MKPFLAVISPVMSGAHPDHELPKPPGTPTHPIAPGGERPTHPIAGLPHPEHPISWPLPPGAPVDPDYGVPIERPTHPIAPGGLPPKPDQGLPGAPPKPDQGLPGPQPHPEHPIALPPDSGGWVPIFIWGPNDPRPTPPIVIPPPVETDDGQRVEFKPVWTPEDGWQVIGVIDPSEGSRPTPTPSRRK
jgi:hypothetical protein